MHQPLLETAVDELLRVKKEVNYKTFFSSLVEERKHLKNVKILLLTEDIFKCLKMQPKDRFLQKKTWHF